MSIATTDHAYRTPTVLFRPGVLFRASQVVTIAILVLVAAAAIAQLWARTAFDRCLLTEPYLACTRMTPLTLSDLGIPLTWQAIFVDMPAGVPALVIVLDLVAAFFVIHPRTARVDPASRTIALHRRRWPRRGHIDRIRYQDVLLVTIRRNFWLHSVQLVDLDGRPYEVTGLCVGRRRAARVAAQLEAALLASV